MSRKKLIAGAFAATALIIGGGAALAAGPDTATTDQTSQQEGPSYKGSIQAPSEQGEQNESADGNEGPDNESADDQQETNESQQLQSLAKIDRTAAEQAALKAVPGTMKETDLESENGFVVYGVEVAGDDGKTHDVKVDAGTGEVLHQQVDGAEGPEQGAPNEDPETNDAPDAGEATE